MEGKDHQQSMSPAHRARPNRGPLAALPKTGVGKAWIGPALLGTALLLTACGREAIKPRVVGSPHRTPVPSAAQLQAERTAAQQRQAAEGKAAAVALRRGWSEGHQSTVACLHGERAQTDGNELRCEDQAYVERNYRAANSR